MIFKQSNLNIVGIKDAQDLDEKSFMVQYLSANGIESTSIVPKGLDQKEMNGLFELLNDPTQLLSISPHNNEHYGMQYDGYSCELYCLRLLHFLTAAYKYTEFLRFNVFKGNNVNQNDPQVLAKLEQLGQIDARVQQVLNINATMIAPIWKGQKNALDINYIGLPPAGIFDGNQRGHNPKEIMLYCLAMGKDSISGIYDYGSYGGIVPDAFIEYMYGAEVAKTYAANSPESIQLHQMVESRTK